MPGLPERGDTFPPEPYDHAQERYAVWNAWYAGDTDHLAALYSQAGAAVRPSQYAGGLAGMVARFFWGRPTLQPSKKLHVPIAADVARTSADLLFAQTPQWVISKDDATNFEKAQARLEQLLEGEDVHATLLEAAELQAALGGVYLRLWWDKDVTDKVMLSAVGADGAIPEWRYGKLAAVTFWTILRDNKEGVWRHLERHEPGAIYHGLYKGEKEKLGVAFPLDYMPETEWAAELVDADGKIATGVKGLTAAYVPNVRPNRGWRNTPGLSQLGRSDFDGLEPLFDALDETMSSWMRDLDHGKSRLFVADEALVDNGPGKGASFDPEQPVFTPLKSGGPSGAAYGVDEGSPNALVQANQFEIRHQEHKATAKELVMRILVSAGYSVADFGDDEMTGSITATEVNARKDLSNRTREKKIGYWRSEAEPLARTMLELDQLVYGGNYGLKANPEMKFPVRPDQTPEQLANTIQTLRTADALSIERSVRMFNPNWSNPEVEKEVDLIRKDTGRDLDDEPSEFDTPDVEEEPHTDLQDVDTDPDHLEGDEA